LARQDNFDPAFAFSPVSPPPQVGVKSSSVPVSCKCPFVKMTVAPDQSLQIIGSIVLLFLVTFSNPSLRHPIAKDEALLIPSRFC